MSGPELVFNRNFPDAAACWRQQFGLDVSGWQSSSVVSDLWSAGHRFDWVIVKCSEGAGYRSVEAAGQIADCVRLGIPFGVYHFVGFTGVDGEIDNLLGALDGLPGLTVSPSMPVQVWLDCEQGGFDRHVVPDGHDAYVDRLARAVEVRGLTVGVYTASWWADGVLFDGSRPLWVADYDDGRVWEGYGQPKLPEAWSSALLWQFTSSSPEFGSLDLNAGPSSLVVAPAPEPAPAPAPEPAPVPVVEPVPVPVLERWLWLADPYLEGDDVIVVQDRLVAWGYQPGPLDGVFGPRTHRAVLEFQRDRDLVADGIVGPLTWQAMWS